MYRSRRTSSEFRFSENYSQKFDFVNDMNVRPARDRFNAPLHAPHISRGRDPARIAAPHLTDIMSPPGRTAVAPPHLL
jgi:hypothetical protein